MWTRLVGIFKSLVALELSDLYDRSEATVTTVGASASVSVRDLIFSPVTGQEKSHFKKALR